MMLLVLRFISVIVIFGFVYNCKCAKCTNNEVIIGIYVS